MKNYTYEIAATILALGLDDGKSVVFRQSDVTEIFELYTILSCFTPKSLMNKGHAYKSLVDGNRESLSSKGTEFTQNDLDSGVNMGLYTYPILMAADMLGIAPEVVPVGKDQIQHVEIARDIAGYFNSTYGQTFNLPDYLIQEDSESVPGFDGRKMSKSYGNTIPIFAEESILRRLIMKIVTDSSRPETPKDPDQSTIVQLYRNFAGKEDIVRMEEAFREGKIGYGDAKQELFLAINSVLAEPRLRYQELLRERKTLDTILASGAEQAQQRNRRTLTKVKRRLGF